MTFFPLMKAGFDPSVGSVDWSLGRVIHNILAGAFAWIVLSNALVCAEVEPRPSPPPPAAQPPQADRETLRLGAFKAFQEAEARHRSNLNQVVTIEDSATQWGEVHGAPQMRAKRLELLESTKSLDEARVFFNNPAEAYRQALVSSGLDSVSIAACLEAPLYTDPEIPALIVAVIDAASRRCASTCKLLKILADAEGMWNFDRPSRQFRFDLQLLSDNYSLAHQELERDADDLTKALRKLSRRPKLKK